MNCGTASIATRPRCNWSPASSRQPRVIVPVTRSRTVYPLPSMSSHRWRTRPKRSGAGSGSPRRTSLEFHDILRAHAVGGQRLPLGGHVGLARIDGRHALDLDQPQVIAGIEYPDLRLRPRVGWRRRVQRGHLAGGARAQLHRPVPRAQLQSQAAIGLETRGQGARKAQGNELGQERIA